MDNDTNYVILALFLVAFIYMLFKFNQQHSCAAPIGPLEDAKSAGNIISSYYIPISERG